MTCGLSPVLICVDLGLTTYTSKNISSRHTKKSFLAANATFGDVQIQLAASEPFMIWLQKNEVEL